MAFAPKPKPRGENETDAAYNKRVANWTRSQERLKSVGIAGGVNKATKEQLDKFTKKYGHGPAGLKPVQGPSSDPQDLPGNPDMSAQNPSAPKPGQGGGGSGGPRDSQSMGMTAGGGSARSSGGFGGPMGALGRGSSAAGQAARQGLSRMASRGQRRARRAARQSMRRSG